MENRGISQRDKAVLWCRKMSGKKGRVTKSTYNVLITVLHQLDQKIIYPHYDFKHLTEKYFEIGMKLNDFSIQLVKYCIKSFSQTGITKNQNGDILVRKYD